MPSYRLADPVQHSRDVMSPEMPEKRGDFHGIKVQEFTCRNYIDFSAAILLKGFRFVIWIQDDRAS